MKSIYLVSLALITVYVECQSQNADMVLYNAKVFTADTAMLYAEAIAVKGSKIIMVGTNEAVRKTAGKKTKLVDLNGKTVIPGLNDAHDHPGWDAPVGKSFTYADFNPAGLSKDAVVDSVARLVKLAGKGQWIQGLIGTTVFFDTTMRRVLDSIAPANPVALQIWWGHGMVLNEMGLKKSGLNDSLPDPVGGWYIRNRSNKINSLQQNAQAPVWIAVKNSEPENLVSGLQAFSKTQLAAGITSIQYMGTGLTSPIARDLFGKAHLQQRVRIIGWPRSTWQGRQMSDWHNNERHKNPLLKISGVKYVIDGTPLEENALRKEPYRDNKYGRLNYPIDTLRRILNEALNSDQQLMMHITADSSFAVILSLMRDAGTPEQWKPKRVRIEHNCVGDISPMQQKMLKDYGILMMHTPKYCMGSRLRSLYENGVVVGISPDGTTNPFVDMMMATSMQSNPIENLTIEQAVIAFTKNNAFSEFSEKEKGMLRPGQAADIVVLSHDIFSMPAQQLPATKSLMTMVDGKIVHDIR